MRKNSFYLFTKKENNKNKLNRKRELFDLNKNQRNEFLYKKTHNFKNYDLNYRLLDKYGYFIKVNFKFIKMIT